MGVCLHKNNSFSISQQCEEGSTPTAVWWSWLDTTLWSKSLVLTKDFEFSCPILPLNNLPKVCYDTSQENVLWRERFWLIEGEGGSSHRRPLGVKSWLVTGEVGGRGGRAGPQVRGGGGSNLSLQIMLLKSTHSSIDYFPLLKRFLENFNNARMQIYAVNLKWC